MPQSVDEPEPDDPATARIAAGVVNSAAERELGKSDAARIADTVDFWEPAACKSSDSSQGISRNLW